MAGSLQYRNIAIDSVSNSVLKIQYRGRYNTGISKISIPVLAGNEDFSRNIPLPPVKTAVKCIQYNLYPEGSKY
jgi:hypothetical protein